MIKSRFAGFRSVFGFLITQSVLHRLVLDAIRIFIFFCFIFIDSLLFGGYTRGVGRVVRF